MSAKAGLDPRDMAPWAIVALVVVALLATGGVWFGGTLGAALNGAGWHSPDFSLGLIATLATEGTGGLWPGASPIAVYCGIILVFGGATAAVVIPAWMIFSRANSKNKGLAGARELAAMCPAGIEQRARDLRPSSRTSPICTRTRRAICSAIWIRTAPSCAPPSRTWNST